MGLSKCSDCGGNVSTRAAACPHCGAPVPHASSTEPSSPSQASLPSPQSTEASPIEDHAIEISLRPRVWYLLGQLKGRAGQWLVGTIVLWLGLSLIALVLNFTSVAVFVGLLIAVSTGVLVFVIWQWVIYWNRILRPGVRIALSINDQSLSATFIDFAEYVDGLGIPGHRSCAFDRRAIRVVEISEDVDDFGPRYQDCEWEGGWPMFRHVKVYFDSDRGRVGQLLFHVECRYWRFDETSRERLHGFIEHLKSCTDFTWTNVQAKRWQQLF